MMFHRLMWTNFVYYILDIRLYLSLSVNLTSHFSLQKNCRLLLNKGVPGWLMRFMSVSAPSVPELAHVTYVSLNTLCTQVGSCDICQSQHPLYPVGSCDTYQSQHPLHPVGTRVRYPSHPGQGHRSLTCHMTQFEWSDWLRSANLINIMIEYRTNIGED